MPGVGNPLLVWRPEAREDGKVRFFVVLFVLRRFLTVGYRQLSELTNQVQVYEALLRDIYPKLEPQSAQYVEQILNEVRTSHCASMFLRD
jgi:Tfp pilus assembly protein PilN